MPSSTSSSEALHRVPDGPWRRTWLLAAGLLAVALGSWEATLRARGYASSVDDDPSLWALLRLNLAPDATAMLGSSRMATDVNLDVWADVVGPPAPTDLTIYATSPLLTLEDLAADERFHGRVLLEVSEAMLFGDTSDLTAQARARLRARDEMGDSLFGRAEKTALVSLQSSLVLTSPQFDLFDSGKALLTGRWPAPTSASGPTASG